MLDKIIEIISTYQGISKEKINLDSNLIKDIELSSFDVTELVCKFEIEIPDRKISTFQTVRDIYEYIKEQQ